MADLTRQQYADLAADAYNTRKVTGRDDDAVKIGGNDYKVLAIHNNPTTGYQGAVYQDVRTLTVIVAHRGTEFGKDPHDTLNNVGMVLFNRSRQMEDALETTGKALAAISEFHAKFPKEPVPALYHTGHSLGGTLAQLAAHSYGHQGVTFNAYGAAGLHGTPEGGNRVVNYALAADAVSAAGKHYGSVVLLALPGEIGTLKSYGYMNRGNTPSIQALGAAAETVASHTIGNFTGPDSVLAERNFDRSRELAEQNKHLIRDFRSDVSTHKNVIRYGGAAGQMLYYTSPVGKVEGLRGRPRTSAMPISSLEPDITQPLAKDASTEAFIDYGFAALLADDDGLGYAAVESLLDTDIARQMDRDNMQAALDYDREQEMLRPRGPVMSL